MIKDNNHNYKWFICQSENYGNIDLSPTISHMLARNIYRIMWIEGGMKIMFAIFIYLHKSPGNYDSANS